jgi:hypothetical protein
MLSKIQRFINYCLRKIMNIHPMVRQSQKWGSSAKNKPGLHTHTN